MAREQVDSIEHRLSMAFRDGDLAAVTATIVEEYGPELLGYLARTMRNQDEASEVFAQFCEDLCRDVPRFEGRSSFRTWVYRVATSARAHFWNDPYRRRARHRMTDEMAKLEQRVRTETLPHLKTDTKNSVARLRMRLDPDEQSLLTLRVDRQMSWNEVAEVLAEPGESLSGPELRSRAAAWRQRFKRIKDQLRVMAREEGLLEPAE